MKKYMLVLGLIILVAGLAWVTLSNGKSKTIKTGSALSVNDIQADPRAYKGTITITGVVARKHPSDPKIFALVDTSEAILCKSTGCAKFYLAVSYEGTIPKVWDEVNITGSFAEGGKLFTATRVDVLKHLTF